MIVVVITIAIDAEIGFIADFIPSQLSSDRGMVAFISLSVIFAITQYFVLAYVKQINKETRARVLHLGLTHSVVSVAQFILAGIFIIIILQELVTQRFNIAALYVSYIISYGLWIVALRLLAKAFSSWYKSSSKNVIVLILTLSMIAYVINGVSGLATNLDFLTQHKAIIYSGDIAQYPEFSTASLGSQIDTANQIASSIAYILTWIGAVKLLYPYIRKLGKIKFWIIMGVAMVYYLVYFPIFVLGYFTPSENVDAMTNILIFSLSGIFTGIIFGAAFLLTARTLQKEISLRNHLLLAAYGFLLFYTAGSAIASQATYPPFGLASVSFTGLSCYLIYSGLYSSAVTVSQDMVLRSSIRKSVAEHSRFLESIGTAEMEQQLKSRVLTISKKLSDKMVEETGVETSMTEDDIKRHIEIVRDEIHRLTPKK